MAVHGEGGDGVRGEAVAGEDSVVGAALAEMVERRLKRAHE